MRPLQLDAVFGTFVVIGGSLPLALCAPLEIFLFHWRAVPAVAAQALLMMAYAEYLVLNLRSIPFTCAQETEQRHLIHSICVHLIELSIYSFSGAAWIHAGLTKPIDYLLLVVVVSGTLVWLHRWRSREWGKEPFAFLELGPRPVEALRLTPE